jgi:outer membrane protein
MQIEEQQRRSVVRQSREAYNGVISGISRVKAFKQAVVSSEKALESTEAGYEVGTRTTVDVLNVRRDLFRAKRDYASSRYDYILSILRLKQAAGIVNVDDLAQINQWLETN